MAYDSSPDTSIQDSIDRMNQQMAADAANAAAQQQFLALGSRSRNDEQRQQQSGKFKLVTWCFGLAVLRADERELREFARAERTSSS